jgi:hypothetical protein
VFWARNEKPPPPRPPRLLQFGGQAIDLTGLMLGFGFQGGGPGAFLIQYRFQIDYSHFETGAVFGIAF